MMIKNFDTYFYKFIIFWSNYGICSNSVISKTSTNNKITQETIWEGNKTPYYKNKGSRAFFPNVHLQEFIYESVNEFADHNYSTPGSCKKHDFQDVDSISKNDINMKNIGSDTNDGKNSTISLSCQLYSKSNNSVSSAKNVKSSLLIHNVKKRRNSVALARTIVNKKDYNKYLPFSGIEKRIMNVTNATMTFKKNHGNNEDYSQSYYITDSKTLKIEQNNKKAQSLSLCNHYIECQKEKKIIQPNRLTTRVNFLKKHGDNIKETYLSCFNQDQLHLFNNLFLTYINGEDYLESDLNAIAEILKTNLALKSDSYYKWKTNNGISFECLKFYNMQVNCDSLLRIIIENEKNTIYKLTDKEYIKYIDLYSGASESYKTFVDNYEESLERNFIFFNANGQIHVPSVLYIPIELFNIKNYTNNDKSIDLFIDRVITDYENFKFNIYFKFEYLYEHTEYMYRIPSEFEPFIEASILKRVLIDVLKNVEQDFKYIFPEIDIIHNYLLESNFHRSDNVNGKTLYTYFVMLNILLNIVKYDWHNLYLKSEEKFKDEKLHNYILRLAVSFSAIKYEIFKLLSYCLLLFIDDNSYKDYAQIRIVECFFLKKENFQNKIEKNTKFNAIYHVGKYNVIIRLLLFDKFNMKSIFSNRKLIPDNELVINFLLNSFKMSEFLKISNSEKDSLIVFKSIERYFYIYTRQYNYFKTINEKKDNSMDSNFLWIETDPKNAYIKRFKTIDNITKTVYLYALNVSKILTFIFEFEGCQL
ncbi:hypothetical protein COBT_000757, partial [Conglomerata obtusa]